MGMDFYSCENCGEIFDDCGSYGVCHKCNAWFCDDCDNKYRVEEENGKCPICSGETVPEKRLLDFALKKLKTSKEKLKREYRDML